MPHYRIHIATSDGSRDSYDLVGPALDQIGAVRALVTETLIEAGRERPPLGAARTIAVTVEDEHRRIVACDAITIRGRAAASPDDQTLWRAIAAMNRVQDGRSG